MTVLTLTETGRAIWLRIGAYLTTESARVSAFINRNLVKLLAGWAALSILAGSLKVLLAAPTMAAAPAANLAGVVLPYLAIALAPIAGYALSSKCFPHGQLRAQPTVRLARIGRWHQLSPRQAQQSPDFGVSGLLVSLIAGLLLSMFIRISEFFLAMPAVPHGAPPWASAMFRVMAFDLVFLSFLYAVCITMALRAAPLFPRMLVYAWLCDVMMQLGIAHYAAAAGGMPTEIAASLQGYLTGNIKKVLISVVIWLPYLLISARVNVTFRNRIKFAPA